MAERNVVGIIDAGGRGHALARAYARSPHVDGIVVIPGNDLIKEMAEKPTEVYPHLKTTSIPSIIQIFRDQGVSLADVAQDNAVEAGVSDALREIGMPTVGPSREAGRIEWSKVDARRLGERASIRQPEYYAAKTIADGERYLRQHKEEGFAVKANGLAEGKGVKIAGTRKSAIDAIHTLKKQFPEASDRYLLEKLAQGEEFSTFFASDGEHVLLLGHAQDHKREGNNDTGENTGGMGAYSPIRLMTPNIEAEVTTDVEKMMHLLTELGFAYEGVGYYGGMFDEQSASLTNIEWNSRWGDPEVQVVAPGIKSDFLELSMAVVDKRLDKYKLKKDNLTRVVVAIASRGYPRNYDKVKGQKVFGVDHVVQMPNINVYGAGIKIGEDGSYRAGGGRLMYIEGRGKNIEQARERAYQAASHIFIPGEDGNQAIFRTDVGWRDVRRLHEEG